MKAFEEWGKKQPVVNIPEPFATFVTQEKERTWKAALEWILKLPSMDLYEIVFDDDIYQIIREEIEE